MNQLACRACRKPLTGKSGCEVCNPIRRNLVVLGETDEDRPSLALVTNEAVNALREQVRHYRDQLRRARKPEVEEELRSRQRSTAGALAKLLDAARKIASDGVAAVAQMSFRERAELFVGWYLTLPSVYREALMDRLNAQEAQLELPAPTEESVQ